MTIDNLDIEQKRDIIGTTRYHCVKIKDEYLSRRRSDTLGVDNRFGFPQRPSDGSD